MKQIQIQPPKYLVYNDEYEITHAQNFESNNTIPFIAFDYVKPKYNPETKEVYEGASIDKIEEVNKINSFQNLKIFKTNPQLKGLNEFDIMSTDFTILNGIVCGEPTYKKGVKKTAPYYIDEKQSQLAVLKSFEDVIENDFLKAIKMKIEWFDEYGNPGLSKQVFIPLSTSEASNILIGRRKRQINYLQEAGVRLGVKQYIDLLFSHYSAYLVQKKTLNLLNNYIENGSNEFENAINSETNDTIKAILNTELPDGNTVKNAILNQIL